MARAEVPYTVLSLLESARKHFEGQGFDEARLQVEILLAHVLGIDRLGLYLQFDKPLSTPELDAFRSLYRRRLNHEPLQYILGTMQFMGLTLKVTPAVLIPRPETEELASAAIAALRRHGFDAPRVLDVGTGSGNIAGAIASSVQDSRVTAIDISAGALAVAEQNMRDNGLDRVELLEADITRDVLQGRMFDMVVSNPPYVSEKEYQTLQPEITRFEPRLATTDGGDGLEIIRAIFRFSRERLVPGGLLMMEIGHGQEGSVLGLAAETGFAGASVAADFAGIPRIFSGRRP